MMDIEKHGLNSVPSSERTATWTDLLIIWGGVSICLPSFIVGAMLVPAFNWDEAMAINFLGNLIVGILIVLGGYFGVRTGYPAVIMLRHVYGHPVGQWLPTMALLVSTLGWYGIITVVTGMAITEMTGQNNELLTTLVIVLVGVLNATTAVAGFHRIRWFNRIMLPLLGGYCVYLAYVVLGQLSLSPGQAYNSTGSLTYGEGIDLIIGGFLVGAMAASDFSRYVQSHTHNWLGTLPGAFLLSFLLGLLGMLSVVVTGEWNPVLAVRELGMGLPALFFILLANWTTNHNLLYSSGLALTNAMPRLERWKSTVICGITGTMLALSGIAGVIESWLIMLSYVFSPILAVALAEVLAAPGKRPASTINVRAVIAVIAGIIVEIIIPPQYVASLAGLLAAAAVYIVLRGPAMFINRRRKP